MDAYKFANKNGREAYHIKLLQLWISSISLLYQHVTRRALNIQLHPISQLYQSINQELKTYHTEIGSPKKKIKTKKCLKHLPNVWTL